LMTLALLKISPSRTPAVSFVVRCLTQMPALPGKSADARVNRMRRGVGDCARTDAESNRVKAAFTLR
jgi:hypothetical protein